MRILFVSAEVAPFAKTGGLADVAAALPRALRRLGHDVRVVMPAYPRAMAVRGPASQIIREATVPMGPRSPRFSVVERRLPDSDVPVYLVRCPPLFDRDGIYETGPDEHVRFSFLSWAALKVCQLLRFAPDVLHANDWHTALAPLLAKALFAWDRLFDGTRSVLTIHNLGHQGVFGADALDATGLSAARDLVHQDELGAGRFSFLLTGILHAHVITTVSPTYARQIQTAEHGVGLDPFLRMRRKVLRGILNGIDEVEWDPRADPYLAHHYSAEDLSGKERVKAQLMAHAGLPYRRERLVMALVSRLVWQKGLDLVMEVLPRFLQRRPVQLVVLGKGEPRYMDFFRELARHFPRQVAYQSRFSEGAAHLFEAGADAFLMPSRYEPCGLNQMYSLRYGTVPIVHRTGGLADTVFPFDGRTHRGTGVVFEHFDGAALTWALERAVTLWGSGAGKDRERWVRIQRNGMEERLGWSHRVHEYERLYRQVAPHAR